jgi:hypothetical protein
MDAPVLRLQHQAPTTIVHARMRALFIVATAALGCGHNIGDECQTNVDCLFDGTRFCDTSPPDGKGYCTIEGCDWNTCPSEAVCIRFLTPVLDESCTLPLDKAVPLGRSDCPHADDRCVCDNAVNGVCQQVKDKDGNLVLDMNGNPVPYAHCAPEATERRWCQKTCGSDGDCRTNYECRATGTLGAEPVPTLETLTGLPATFCAPKRP